MGIAPLLLTLETTFFTVASIQNLNLFCLKRLELQMLIERQMLFLRELYFPHKWRHSGLYKTLPQTRSLHAGQIDGFPYITLPLSLKGTGKFPPVV